jgi:hypothetical protein
MKSFLADLPRNSLLLLTLQVKVHIVFVSIR